MAGFGATWLVMCFLAGSAIGFPDAAIGRSRPDGTPNETIIFGSYTTGAVFNEMNIWMRSVAQGPTQLARIVNIGWAPLAKVQAQIASVLGAWESSGAVPVLTWMPYAFRNWTSPTPNTDITEGNYDDYIDAFFTELSSQFVYGQTPPRRLFLRFAPDPNGNWYPWSPSCPSCGGQSISQTAASYVKMFQYVVQKSRLAKYNFTADTVQWMFDVSTYSANGPPFVYYPGSRYVSWLAATGNNFGNTLPGNSWTSVQNLYGPTLAELVQLDASAPIALNAAGSVSAPLGIDAKASWLQELVHLPWLVGGGGPRIRMITYQNADTSASDLAVFGGQEGAVLYTAPGFHGSYWAYPSLVSSMINTTFLEAGYRYAAWDPANRRLLPDAVFFGAA